MFCTKCGSLVEDGDAFCGNCGNRIANPIKHDEPKADKAAEKKKRAKIIAIAVSAVLVAAVVAVGIFFAISNNNSADNFDEDYLSMYRSNMALFDDNFGGAYYRVLKSLDGNYYVKTVYDSKIYALTESQLEEACSNKSLWRLTDEDDYPQWSYGEEFFDLSQIGEDEGYCRNIQSYKNSLYIQVDSGIYRVDCKDSDNVQQIYSGDLSSFFIYDNYAYIITGDLLDQFYTIQRCPVNGGDAEVIVNGTSGFVNMGNSDYYLMNAYASGGYLYFVLTTGEFEDGLLYCRCRLDGTEKEVWQTPFLTTGLAANEDTVAVISTHSNGVGTYFADVTLYDSETLAEKKAYDVELPSQFVDEMGYDDKDEPITLVFPMLFNGSKIEYPLNNFAEYAGDLGYYNLTFDNEAESLTENKNRGFFIRTAMDEAYSMRIAVTEDTMAGYLEKVN